MSPYTLSKNSWHARLYNWNKSSDNKVAEGSAIDLCSYIGDIFSNILLIILVSLIIGTVAGSSLYAIGNFISWLFLGYQLAEFTMVLFVVYVIFGLIITIPFLFEYLKERRYRKQAEKDPGFVTLAYRKFKDKTCVMLEFK